MTRLQGALFPTVSCVTLTGETLVLPGKGLDALVVCLGFSPMAELEILSWKKIFDEMTIGKKGCLFYEIHCMSPEFRPLHDEYRQKGLYKTRQSAFIAYCYGDPFEYKAYFGVSNSRSTGVFVVSPDGRIIYTMEGMLEPSHERGYMNALEEYLISK